MPSAAAAAATAERGEGVYSRSRTAAAGGVGTDGRRDKGQNALRAAGQAEQPHCRCRRRGGGKAEGGSSLLPAAAAAAGHGQGGGAAIRRHGVVDLCTIYGVLLVDRGINVYVDRGFVGAGEAEHLHGPGWGEARRGVKEKEKLPWRAWCSLCNCVSGWGWSGVVRV